MLATKDLMKEQQPILKYVDLIERYAEFDIKNLNASILFEKADCFIQFIHEFADDFHHAEEDNILYPLAERGLPDKVKSSLVKEYTETGNRLNSQAIWHKYEILCTELEQQLNVEKETASKSDEHETRVLHEKG